ncbi:unnamed protein product, partial [Ectocarpus sp. 13 AM-2016]
MPCPIAREIGELLNLSPGNATAAAAATATTDAAGSGGKVSGAGSSTTSRSSSGSRWLHDVLEVAETMKAERVEIILDEKEYEEQSLLHPALADMQGPSVSVVLPGTVVTDKQLTMMLSSPVKPAGGVAAGDLGEGGGSMGRPRMGNSVTALFALTDCLQVLSHDSLFLFDPCGEYLFSGADPPTLPFTDGGPSNQHTKQSGAGSATGSAAAPRSRRASSSSSRGSSPSSSFFVKNNASPGSSNAAAAAASAAAAAGQPAPRPRSAFSSSAGAGANRLPVTGIGGGGGRHHSGGPRRDPIGRSYVVRREDVLNQFPHQYAPFLALPGGLGETIGEGLTSGRGYHGTVFRMSLRTRPGDISSFTCTIDAVERE